MDLGTYEDDIVQAVRERLHKRLAAADAAGALPKQLRDPALVADSMVAALPGVHPLDTIAGPFYDTASLTTWLGITRQALHKQIRASLILACRTADGHTVYPVWQFTSSGQLLTGLRDVLAALCAATEDPWTVAVWLRTPVDDLGGRSAVEWLQEGRDPQPVLHAARADAARWAA